MIFRPGTEDDIPQIIQLLKISLGESLLPKSEALWKWKHLDNPFGKSPVLLAEEDGKIIGVRAFLNWEFTQSNKLINSCRAVDTAIHPDFQGKGLFTKLTLNLIDQIREDGFQLIYNTPNTQSLPGYLKMGWEKWGKLPLKMKFHVGSSRSKPQELTSDWTTVQSLIREIEAQKYSGAAIQTHLIPGYLNWRYADCPLFPYQFLSDQVSYLLIFRIKEGKMGRELRITDFFTFDSFGKTQKKELNKELKNIQKQSGARFTSFSGLAYSNQQAPDLGILPVLSIGPIITLRKVSEDSKPMNLPWGWSLGDLEVF